MVVSYKTSKAHRKLFDILAVAEEPAPQPEIVEV